MILGIETSCDETAAALVTSGRRGALVDRRLPGRAPRALRRCRAGDRLAASSRARRPRRSRGARRGRRGSRSTIVTRIGVTQGPGPDRRAARRALGRQGDRLVARDPARPGRPPAGSRRVAVPRRRSRRAAVRLPARERRPHAAARRARARRRSSGSARRSTTRPVRRSTRALGCSGSPYPGGAAIDALARQGDPEAFRFPVARVPGLDFSFSGRQDVAPLRRPRSR